MMQQSDTHVINGKTIKEWILETPEIRDIAGLRETAWINPDKLKFKEALDASELKIVDVQDAADRLKRFAAYFEVAFPETKATGGILESPLKEIPLMRQVLTEKEGEIFGRLFLKLDSHLPISGSIKARGGIYEILKLAEDIALQHGLLHPGDDYSVFAQEKFHDLFSMYSVAVGSTGNLGLSIGIISAKLGFKVTVHMSSDARKWKKDMLKSRGVTVKEYQSDYSVAVAKGRMEAEKDPYCHFVDDENSRTLFLGYSVAALRLKEQFLKAGIMVDHEHPLFVYLPCGVGGGPGGVAFGLKMVYGDDVHCFFAEPTHSCSMMLGMITGANREVSVQDFGIDNRTIADGLAVGRPSGFVGKLMRPFISGCYSLTDERMLKMLCWLADSESVFLEPSALAGMYGPVLLAKHPSFLDYLKSEDLVDTVRQGTQLVWATGGSMVPQEDMDSYYRQGKALD